MLVRHLARSVAQAQAEDEQARAFVEEPADLARQPLVAGELGDRDVEGLVGVEEGEGALLVLRSVARGADPVEPREGGLIDPAGGPARGLGLEQQA
jgi:hypothetical protein